VRHHCALSALQQFKQDLTQTVYNTAATGSMLSTTAACTQSYEQLKQQQVRESPLDQMLAYQPTTASQLLAVRSAATLAVSHVGYIRVCTHTCCVLLPSVVTLLAIRLASIPTIIATICIPL